MTLLLAVASPVVSVGSQYDSAHVYVAPADLDRFVSSFTATFGGSASKRIALTVTPTPSRTCWRFITSPVGALSVFGFLTPIPYPFGSERTGWLVTGMDTAVAAAEAAGAAVVVQPFPDPVGRDTIVDFPGGLRTQLYWHFKAPHFAHLASIPDNRFYVAPASADALVRSLLAFSHGSLTSDDRTAPGTEVGSPGETYRRIRLTSPFGNFVLLATSGQLAYPYGRETMGYRVKDLDAALRKAEAAGAAVLVAAHPFDGGREAMLRFPGGYIVEVHAS
ncbi:MAG TPA: hypothetical protein VGG51_01290 [Candidatus Cybelea sp.]